MSLVLTALLAQAHPSVALLAAGEAPPAPHVAKSLQAPAAPIPGRGDTSAHRRRLAQSLQSPAGAMPQSQRFAKAPAADVQPVEAPALLRKALGELALQQVKAIDPAWSVEQRDCAGFIRFVYRQTFRRLSPQRLAAPLFVARDGTATDFVDAENLALGRSFTFLGRGAELREQLQTGDVLAFRQEREGGEVFHLMLVVRPQAALDARVVYHPGEPGAAVRQGALASLAREAPVEWRPQADNPSFLGFYRFTEWTR